MKRRSAVFAAIASTLVWAACNGTSGPEGPDPGPVTLTLNTPNSNDGGVRFLVTGGTIDSVTASAHEVFHARIEGGMRVIVIGTLASSGVAQLWIPDRRNIDDYDIVLEEVAARGTFANRSLSEYSLTVAIP